MKDRPRTSKNAEADDAKRSMLLGSLALLGLGACATSDSPPDQLTLTEQSLSAPDDFVDNLASLAAAAPPAVAATVIVLGGVYRSDGGGGLFRWDSGDTATADGFRIVKPNATTGAGRWVRLIEGNVVSCKWFGAGLGALSDDAVGINAALRFLIGDAFNPGFDGGGTLIIPDGIYQINSSIEVPHHSSRPVRIVGRGPASSSLRGGAMLSSTDAMMRFTAPQGSYGQVTGFHLEGVGLSRVNQGPVFQHKPVAGTPTDDDPVNRRFEGCQLRNVWLSAATAVAGSSYPNLEIQFAGNCHFEDLLLDGGATCVKLSRCTRTTVRNVRVTKDYSTVNAMHLEHCSDMTLTNIRIESTSGGFGIELERARRVTLDSVTFEGKVTNPQLSIVDSSFVQVSQFGGGGQTIDNAKVISISGTSSAIRFTDGYIAGGGPAGATNVQSISIGAGVVDVIADGTGIMMFDGTDANVASQISVDSTAKRIRLDLRFCRMAQGGLVFSDGRYAVRGAAPVLAAASSVRVRDSDEIFIQGSAAISNLEGGYVGQRLVLTFNTAGTTVSGPQFRLSAPFSSAAGSVLSLVFNGSIWAETGRLA